MQSLAETAITSTRYPDYDLFIKACENGLSVAYPFKSREYPDPYGWKFSPGFPPSYPAFGRMRSLLAIQDALNLKPSRVLEVATGGGGLAASLAAQGCHVTANDLLQEKAAAALKEYTSGDLIQLVGGNMFELSPRTLGTFDLVIACEVIEHVAHPLDLLQHLKSFLVPGGRILLTTPNGLHFRNRLPTFREISDFGELESRQFMPDADGHLFLFTPEEFCDLAVEAGLKVEQLNLWGTPIISGHSGFRFLASQFLTRIAYQMEALSQKLPVSTRTRLCVTFSAILSSAKERN